MRSGTKGPRLRYPVGSFVKMADDRTIYEVIEAYRLVGSPSTWVYRLKENPCMDSHPHLHRVWWEVRTYPPNSDTFNYNRVVRNEDMIRHAEHRFDDIFMK
jgi:hypothetical protein